MIPVLLAGAGVGFGLALVLSGLLPARTPLAVAAARLHRLVPGTPPPGTAAAGHTQSAVQRALRVLARSLGLERYVERSVEADLRVVGSSLDDHVASRLLAAIVGLALTPATAALMWSGGVNVSPAIPGLLSPLLGAPGFFVPTLTLRSQAAERRRSFRHALSSFLDLVSCKADS